MWNVLSKGKAINHMFTGRVERCGLVRRRAEVRSGHIKGEGTVYCPHHLTSCLAMKMSCLESRRRLLGYIYTTTGGNMYFSYAAV